MKIKFKNKEYKIPATPEYFSNELGGYKPNARKKFMEKLGLGKVYEKQINKREKDLNSRSFFKPVQ